MRPITELWANVCQLLLTTNEIKFVETLEMIHKKGVFFQKAAMVKGEWLPQ